MANCDHAVTFKEGDDEKTYEVCMNCNAYRVKFPHMAWSDWSK